MSRPTAVITVSVSFVDEILLEFTHFRTFRLAQLWNNYFKIAILRSFLS